MASGPAGALRADFLRADLAVDAGLDKRQVWEQTIDEAQRELEKYPDHPDAWAALATAYQALGSFVKAEEAKRQYQRLNPQGL